MIINEQLLRRLFYENYQTLFEYAASMTRNEETAKNITVQAFYRLHQRQSSIQNEAHIRPFLFVVVRNQCIDYFKTRRDILYDEAKHASHLADEPEVYKYFANKDFRAWMDVQITKLSPQLQKVVKLWLLEDLDNAAIAERLNLMESNVRVIKSRAIKILRKAWAADGLDVVLFLLLFVWG